jgi:tripartite-type tricarboxylate transporter receptor subunit TctC
MASVILAGRSRSAWALDYPVRAVTLSVGLAAGGGTDLVARLLADWLSRRLGQSFVVENRTGMGGNLSTERVLKSAPDGYTLLFAGPNTTIGASLYKKLPFNFRRDAAPVAFLMEFPNVMVVPSSLPVQSVQEFIDYAKRYPGKLTYASSGHGTSLHLCGAMFSLMTKIEMTHVPYRGSRLAYPDLIEGRVHVMFDNITIASEMTRGGKVRALGVTSPVRWEAVPEIPAVAETVPGFEAMVWYGIIAPKDTPRDIVLTLNKAVGEAINDADFRARLADTGGLVMSMTPDQFEKFIEEDIERWRKVVDFAQAWVE